ncbi:hypothetical protein GCM10027169_25110 [Gordonia jinhuaensis]|uniref:Uncharacterized protein n=1 Tax=Gordonia jinhuaensis TaxID=1517702 RepID=A0A916TBV2_9ACTN|nr:hypothetical protein GCM10011489_28710 [Gordonia jinhuaensis]
MSACAGPTPTNAPAPRPIAVTAAPATLAQRRDLPGPELSGRGVRVGPAAASVVDAVVFDAVVFDAVVFDAVVFSVIALLSLLPTGTRHVMAVGSCVHLHLRCRSHFTYR